MKNLDTGLIPPRFGEVADFTYTILGGALGWIDTDISNSGIPAGSVGAFLVAPTANQDAGVRAAGSSVDTKTAVANGVPSFLGFATVSGSIHVELYRAAANQVYHLRGWLY